MNRNWYFGFLLLLAVVAISCETKEVIVDPGYKYPVAAFSYTGNDGPAPVTIQFNNYSETIVTDSCHYTWTFGENGPTSTEKNPVHVFTNTTSNAKVYLVTMRVHDLVSNLSQARSIPIEVQPGN